MNGLKERLSRGEFVTALWANFGNSDIAEAMVLAGWDTIVIDGEHGPGDVEQWVTIARAIALAGGEVVLRVPHGQPWLLNRVLDRGFRSIIVPRINTPDEARAVADACRFPPHGSRGYAASIVRGSGFGTREGYGLEIAHEEVCLMVQCEHHIAVENIEEMASIEGIDALFVGPNDLAGSINRIENLNSPDVLELTARVESECRKQGRLLGTITGAGRGYAELKALGYSFVVGGADVSLFMNVARSALNERNEALGLPSRSPLHARY